MALTKMLSADIKLYFDTVAMGTFVIGKRGVNLECTRDMIDVTAQTTFVMSKAKAYQPGLQGAKLELDGLYVISTPSDYTDLDIPVIAANFAQTLKAGTECKALLNIYPGTDAESYLDSETIEMYGYVSNVKVSAGSLADATTFSATFTVSSELDMVDGSGDPIYE